MRVGAVFVAQLTAYFCWHTHYQRSIRDNRPFGNHSTRTDNAVLAHYCAIQNDGIHPDDRVVLYGCAMDRGIMTNGHVVADRAREIIFNMYHAVILDVRVRSDRDRLTFGAHDHTWIDRRMLADGDVAQKRAVTR